MKNKRLLRFSREKKEFSRKSESTKPKRGFPHIKFLVYRLISLVERDLFHPCLCGRYGGLVEETTKPQKN
jgi:hypothetical protein